MYILKFNFEHHLSEYNSILIPLYLLILVSPLTYKLTKNLQWTALAIYLPAITLMTVLIGISEGLEAAGACWLAMIPVVGGMIFGFRGVILGIGLLATTLVVYGLGYAYDWLPHLVSERQDMPFERRFNIVAFCIFASFVAVFVVRTEKSNREDILRSRAETDELIRIIIHDIASPLLNIRAIVIKALRKGDSSEDLAKALKAVSQQSDNMDEILTRVREMRAMAEGKMQARTKPISIKVMVSEAIELMQPRAEKKKIEILTSYNGDPDPIILADEALFKNAILGNILSNAIKFSESESRIFIRCVTQDDTVTMEIQDYGVGMPKDICDNLFEIGQPTSRLGTEGEKGTGFGMVIVKEWTEKHNGLVLVESRETPGAQGARGTTFRLVFPRHQENSESNDESNLVKLKKAS